MSQSLVKNYIHLVFSTKYREPLINVAIESDLYAYLIGICNQLECQPVKIEGFPDHIHILYLLSKKIPLIKLVEELKSHSSQWIKTKGDHYLNLFWQGGYGTFSVNPPEIDLNVKYIENQKVITVM